MFWLILFNWTWRRKWKWLFISRKRNDDLIIVDESIIDKSNLKKKKKDNEEFTFSKFMSKVINIPIIIYGVSLFITKIPPFQIF